MSLPLVVELTAPALFVAGATTSLHCALMCGAINAAQVRSQGPVPLRQTLLLVHGGRVLGYALLGLLAGAIGARLAFLLPDTLGGGVIQLLASLTLVVAGLQQWRGTIGGEIGVRVGFRGHATGGCARHGKPTLTPISSPFFLSPRGRLFAQGLLWALMPCGILYTALLLAALTASPPAGFGLLAAFGLGTVPLMGVSGGLFGLATRPQDSRGLRRAAAVVLIALGVSAAYASVVQPAFLDGLCAPADWAARK